MHLSVNLPLAAQTEPTVFSYTGVLIPIHENLLDSSRQLQTSVLYCMAYIWFKVKTVYTLLYQTGRIITKISCKIWGFTTTFNGAYRFR